MQNTDFMKLFILCKLLPITKFITFIKRSHLEQTTCIGCLEKEFFLVVWDFKKCSKQNKKR